jgi:hypothetical protein
MATLINNIADLKSVLGGVQRTMAWATWEPFVKQGRYAFIEKSIGEEFYQELAAIQNPQGKQLGLIERLRNAEGYFAYLIGFPQLIIITGDGGIAVSIPDKTQAMGKWMYVNTIKQLNQKADSFLEDALQYLEKNKDDFATWKDSDAYTISHSSFISSATELTKYLPVVRNSRRMYLTLREYIAQAEDLEIKQVLGIALFDFLKAKLISDDAEWTIPELNVLRSIRYSIANLAIANSVLFLNISEDYRLISETDGILNEDVLTEARRNEIKYNCETLAKGHLAELQKYLDSTASATVFTEYYNSEQYSSTAKKKYQRMKNDSTKSYAIL